MACWDSVKVEGSEGTEKKTSFRRASSGKTSKSGRSESEKTRGSIYRGGLKTRLLGEMQGGV